MLSKIIFRTFIFANLAILAAACKLIPAQPTPGPNTTIPSASQSTQIPSLLAQTPVLPPSETPFTIQQATTPATQPPLPSLTPTNPPTSVPADVSVQAGAQSFLAQTDPFQYEIQPGSPAYLSNFSRPDLGCGVQSVAGQVFEKDKNPVNPANPIIINVSGVLNGKTIDDVGITGNSVAYGPSGYEVNIATQPYASTHAVSIWLTDLSGKEISDHFSFDTFADCQKNLILINFQTNKPYKYYFPHVNR